MILLMHWRRSLRGDRMNAVLSDNERASDSDSLKISNVSSPIEVFTIEACNWGSSLDSLNQPIEALTRSARACLETQKSNKAANPYRRNLRSKRASATSPDGFDTGLVLERRK